MLIPHDNVDLCFLNRLKVFEARKVESTFSTRARAQVVSNREKVELCISAADRHKSTSQKHETLLFSGSHKSTTVRKKHETLLFKRQSQNHYCAKKTDQNESVTTEPEK